MISRKSRDDLAQALRQYVSGRISNDDLADVEVDWRDRGAIAVAAMAWQLYDDHHEHWATGRHKIEKADRRTISRWIAFLYSDAEYLWPAYSFYQTGNTCMNILTFGWWNRMEKRRWEEFLEAGEFDAWPFCRKADVEQILSTPRLLSGRRPQPSTGR